jgi:hypothetical protein
MEMLLNAKTAPLLASIGRQGGGKSSKSHMSQLLQKAWPWVRYGEGPPTIQSVGVVHVDVKKAMEKDVEKFRTR